MCRRHLDGLRQPGDQVAAAHYEGPFASHRKSRSHRDLDVFGGALADQQAHVATHVRHDRLIHLVTSDANRCRGDDAAERDDRDFGGATSDVDHHRARGGLDRKAGADRGRHRLLDEVRLARSGHGGSVRDRSLFDFRNARWDADHNARVTYVPRAVVGACDEVPDHLLGVVEVGDHAIAHRTYRHDVRRLEFGPAERLDGGADAEHLARAGADRDNRRFVDDDAAAADMHEGVRRAEVDADVGRPHPQHGGKQAHRQDVEEALAKARDGPDHTPGGGVIHSFTP